MRVLTDGQTRIEGKNFFEVMRLAYDTWAYVGSLEEQLELLGNEDEIKNIKSKYDLEGKNKDKNLVFSKDGKEFEFFTAPIEILGDLDKMSRFILEKKFCKSYQDWYLV